MANRRLRIQSLTVQVELAWDDGDELTPGPSLNPIVASLSQAREMLEGLPAEVAQLAEQLATEGAEQPSPGQR